MPTILKRLFSPAQNGSLEHFLVLATADAVFKICFLVQKSSPRDGWFGFQTCECLELRAPLGSLKRSSFTFGPESRLTQQTWVRKSCSLGFAPPQLHASTNNATPKLTPAGGWSRMASGLVSSSKGKDGGWGTPWCPLTREDTSVSPSAPVKLLSSSRLPPP